MPLWTKTIIETEYIEKKLARAVQTERRKFSTPTAEHKKKGNDYEE